VTKISQKRKGGGSIFERGEGITLSEIDGENFWRRTIKKKKKKRGEGIFLGRIGPGSLLLYRKKTSTLLPVMMPDWRGKKIP